MKDNKITPYSEINKILIKICDDIKKILEANLIGIYLFGSLSYEAQQFCYVINASDNRELKC